MNNLRILTETLLTPQTLAAGTFLEQDGQVVLEAEHFSQRSGSTDHDWLTQASQPGYTGTSYLQALPDIDIPLVAPTEALSANVTAAYPIQFTTPGTYTVWSRGHAPNGAGDSLHVGLNGQLVSESGFEPGQWDWANEQLSSGDPAQLSITTTGLYTLTTAMREDGLRLDRLLLTTDTTYLPTGFGPAETTRHLTATTTTTTLTRTIVYTYDDLYRLTAADYSTGEAFGYAYDPMGNQTIITESLASTIVTTYTYNAANQLVTARADDDGIIWHYTYDPNGNLLRQTPGGTDPAEGETRYTYDAANRLVQVELFTGGSYTLLSEAEYNGDGERVALTTWAIGISQTVNYVVGEDGLLVSDDSSQATLYLYGQSQIAEYGPSTGSGQAGWSYPLRDSSSSVRQMVDGSGGVTSARTYKPFGEILQEGGPYQSAFGFVGAQLDRVSGLLYANGRYYDPATGRYLTPDYGQANPYTPVQYPGMWLLLPLIGIVVAWRGRKNGTGRVLLLVVVLGFGVTLVSCGGTPTPIPTPSPIPPPLTPTAQRTQYVQSPTYGFFDRSHIGFPNSPRPAEVVNWVRLHANNPGEEIPIAQEGDPGFAMRYRIIRAIPPEKVDSVALTILQDFSIEYENWQLSLRDLVEDPILGLMTGDDQRPFGTWFANEDLVSNQIGFLAAIMGKDPQEILDKLGATIPAEDADLPSRENITDLGHPSRNGEFRPRIPDGTGGYKNIDFPSDCNIDSEGATQYWERVVLDPATGKTARNLGGQLLTALNLVQADEFWPNEILRDPRDRGLYPPGQSPSN